jgi:hypothetical protein
MAGNRQQIPGWVWGLVIFAVGVYIIVQLRGVR